MHIIKSYRDLALWHVSMELAEFTYAVTNQFPRDERFGLTADLRRTSVTIPSNVAEGHQLSHNSYVNHLLIALGSSGELDTQYELSRRLKFLQPDAADHAQFLTTRVGQLSRATLRGLGHRWSR